MTSKQRKDKKHADALFALNNPAFGPEKPVPMKTVKNLMSGLEIQIAVDTPLCCDPSSETYWSM